MKSPETYRGFNDKNECIITREAVNVSETLIDPAEVQTAIENIKTTMETQLKIVSGKLRDEVSAAETALIVKGTHMGKPIEDTAAAIDKIPNALYENLSDVYSKAEEAHDKLQDLANDQARNEVTSAEGFHHLG